ncbi:hypothetical protein DAPPUDRAFT_330615 [Daphnia pulex]|uniref:Uncharacterized protein n=1 Tax=Daphnia pulex TaxID=6669 RepID=E9HK39_DAPPU|nr:hypothetical protein DAPPUDRAFT_330615 [Daphnia pulex]|eukprot:EFX67814.1 hypothetical protein DAPPUDRAFT_330615 [Daphnia pulex]
MRFEIVCLLALAAVSAYATSPVATAAQPERFLLSTGTLSFTTFTVVKASDPVAEVSSTSIDESSVVPLEIEAGFAVPEGSGPNRFLLAIGTSTITSIIVTSTTVSLTAFCASTSGFPVCGGAGK